ncbi:PAS domain S-box protein [Desulfogranum mediterraneum]|uniref:PAS domain S-box protein n=1 Tax=Desulfogranum mediterraneum TaxID=160661 RepID=UPI0003F93AFF|nr:PAS domain S-box protein [Desulfogranum mediterraneum]
MNPESIKVLLIEDNPGDARLIKELFSECLPGSFDLRCEDTLAKGVDVLGSEEIDIILLDLSLPDSQGFTTFTRVHDLTPEIPIIVLTGLDDETLAIRAVKEGAQDYLAKGHVSRHLLARATRYAIERKRTEEDLRRMRDELEIRVQERTAELEQANRELRAEIKERHKAEQTVLANEEKYRTLFEDSRDAIAVVTRSGQFLEINQAGLDLFGYSRNELMTKNIAQLYADQSKRDEYKEKIEREGSIRDYEVVFLKKNGQEMDCLLTSTLKYTKDGNILGYQGVFRDITAYKGAIQALRESEARYRAIVEDQTELIFRSMPDQTITFVNEAFCRYFNRQAEEVIGTNIFPFLLEEDREKAREQLALLNPGQPVGTLELRAVQANGAVRWQQWTNHLIFDSQNRLKEFQCVGRDVSRQKQMEEALHRSAEKIKLFAYSVSHDLKSPAIGVHGLTNLLHKQYCDVLDSKGASYCEQILKSSEQIIALVEQINLYISTKEVSLFWEKVKLERVLQIIQDEFSARLSIRSIQWTVPDVLPEIQADRLALLRVFRNLVDNALKYGGDDLSEIAVNYEESPLHHIISVRDDGIGIGREDSQKIFDEFQRNDDVKGIEGSGLGLAIVKEISEQHGGRVWAQPASERGSIFYVSIAKGCADRP